jgi:rod shape-determining protein MreD
MIRDQVKYGLLLLIIMVFSLKFSALYSVYSVKPDLILIFLIRKSLNDPKPHTTVLWGFSAGMILDLLIGDVIGISSLSYSIVCFFTAFYKRTVAYLPGYKRALLYVCAVLFSSLLIHSVTLSGLPFYKNFAALIIPASAYTLMIALIIQTFKPTK